MVEKKVIIKLNKSLESRQVALLVQLASRFVSNVYLETVNSRYNAKSIMGMMTLGLDDGESVTVIAEGPDEEKAASEVEAYLLERV